MTSFKLPITDVAETINQQVSNDLELLSSFQNIIEPSNILGEKTLPLWTKQYTSDKNYLKDTQKLLQKKLPRITHSVSEMNDIWNHVKASNNEKYLDNDDLGFHAKYQYIEWEWLQKLNSNSAFLQCLSMYNMTSPLISFCLPIIFLLLPFFIIRVQGKHITFEKYYEVLKIVFQRHQIGQLFSISSATWDKRIYIIISVIFYVLQIYQNIRSCITFYKNMGHIRKELFVTREHVSETITYMDSFLTQTEGLKTYAKFNDNMQKHRKALLHIKTQLNPITETAFSTKNVNEVGHVMKCFYQLYRNQDFKTALNYSFDFCGYIDNLNGIQQSISCGRLGKCKFSKKHTEFYNAYYPLSGKTPVKNTYDLNNHIMITGPNAAGKTTILKATLFNIIITQQIGYGCYERATLAPFDKIHCYINIPDTSGRDSLFQAEARRCKEILSLVEESTHDTRHFCVFDELYSGTNPYEAIGSACSFLDYLDNFKNVSFIITTHFLDLCEKLDTKKGFSNCHMKVLNLDENDFKYTYKISQGISHIKGGVKVLKDLEYPQDIIKGTKKIIENLTF